MNKAKLSQDENLSFKVSHQLLPQDYQRIDLYFSLPVEMGINPSTLNEEEFFTTLILKTTVLTYADQITPAFSSKSLY